MELSNKIIYFGKLKCGNEKIKNQSLELKDLPKVKNTLEEIVNFIINLKQNIINFFKYIKYL
jgi:hypothetical protein